jgi:dienelactone hydrolase
MSSTVVHNTNQACCNIPPVQSDYTPKGTFKSYGGFNRVYVTGSASSNNAIVCVFDIFGFFPQTQQGADIIASTLKTTVYMPDFFEPHPPFPVSKSPPTCDQDKADLQAFFGGTANPGVTMKKLTSFGQILKSSGVKKVGVYGFCWGGKVAVCSGGEGTPFDAISIVHPAMLSVDDAQKLTVPFAIYISNDEPIDEFNRIVETISQRPFASMSDSKVYQNMSIRFGSPSHYGR